MQQANCLSEALPKKLNADCIQHDLLDEWSFEFSTSPKLFVVYDKALLPTPEDVTFILEVFANKTAYIEKARNFLQLESKTQPAQFGLAKSEAFTKPIEVSDPHFIFRLDKSWDIHFNKCGLSDCKNGLWVTFFESIPISFEKINSMDAWYDDETKTWVES
jgi:hypothetical protein